MKRGFEKVCFNNKLFQQGGGRRGGEEGERESRVEKTEVLFFFAGIMEPTK